MIILHIYKCISINQFPRDGQSGYQLANNNVILTL